VSFPRFFDFLLLHCKNLSCLQQERSRYFDLFFQEAYFAFGFLKVDDTLGLTVAHSLHHISFLHLIVSENLQKVDEIGIIDLRLSLLLLLPPCCQILDTSMNLNQE